MNWRIRQPSGLTANSPCMRKPFGISAEDTEKLQQLCSASSSFRPFGGFKNCGGDHPDYCLEWENADERYLVEICLGCHEMKLFWNEREIYCDINKNAYDRFETILKKYRKNRPTPKL